jgi:thiamine-phosphate pyrophosphorylase
LGNQFLELKNNRPQRQHRIHSFAFPIFCYVTDRAVMSPEKCFLERLRRLLDAGIDLVQIREKATPTEELLRLAEKVLALPRQRRQKIVLNDRLDIALACGFDGAHLGGASFPVEEVRRHVPKNFIIGVSTHHVGEAVAAERAGADYVIFGPVFPTPSKLKYGPPQGVEELGKVVAPLSIPVLAIGGISLRNFRGCLDAGAAGVAAISLFQTARSVRSLLAQLHGS